MAASFDNTVIVGICCLFASEKMLDHSSGTINGFLVCHDLNCDLEGKIRLQKLVKSIIGKVGNVGLCNLFDFASRSLYEFSKQALLAAGMKGAKAIIN
jgi:hypothetical protein